MDDSSGQTVAQAEVPSRIGRGGGELDPSARDGVLIPSQTVENSLLIATHKENVHRYMHLVIQHPSNAQGVNVQAALHYLSLPQDKRENHMEKTISQFTEKRDRFLQNIKIRALEKGGLSPHHQHLAIIEIKNELRQKMDSDMANTYAHAAGIRFLTDLVQNRVLPATQKTLESLPIPDKAIHKKRQSFKPIG